LTARTGDRSRPGPRSVGIRSSAPSDRASLLPTPAWRHYDSSLYSHRSPSRPGSRTAKTTIDNGDGPRVGAGKPSRAPASLSRAEGEAGRRQRSSASLSSPLAPTPCVVEAAATGRHLLQILARFSKLRLPANGARPPQCGCLPLQPRTHSRQETGLGAAFPAGAGPGSCAGPS